MITAAIHPRCAMDEKAKIFRSCVWFRPIHPPRATEEIARVVSNVGFSEWEVIISRVVGGNFIIVERSRAVVMGEPCSTSGNQK